MSEQQTAEAAATEPEATADEQPKPEKPTETVDFWKQKAREQEKRAKENADAAKRLAALEDEQKTAEQKANERLAEVERRASELAAREARMEVATETGVPADVLAGPTDSTPEAIKAFADLVADYAEKAGKPRAPRPDPTQGRPAGGVPTDPRAADLAQIEADLAATKRR